MPGQTVTLWGTGLGGVQGSDSVPADARQSATPIDVEVGGQVAQVSYGGRSPCCPGVDQINLQIPDSAPLGCFVPVSVRVRGAVYSNVEPISISADGSGCQGAHGPGPPGAEQRTAQFTGQISLSRMVNNREANDLVEGIFFQTQDSLTLAVAPAPGTCLLLLESPPLSGSPLDAGPQLSVSGPAGGVLAGQQDASYRAQAPPGPLFLGPGSYSVSGPGGADIGSFAASIEVPEPLQWDLGDSSDRIIRNRGFRGELAAAHRWPPGGGGNLNDADSRESRTASLFGAVRQRRANRSASHSHEPAAIQSPPTRDRRISVRQSVEAARCSILRHWARRWLRSIPPHGTQDGLTQRP